MKGKKKLNVPVISLALVAVGLLLLSVGSIDSVRANLTFFSQDYTAEVNMQDIGITLNENGEAVSWRDYWGKDNEDDPSKDGKWDEENGALLTKMLDTEKGEELVLGKSYPELLTVTNSSGKHTKTGIDEYVRVTLYKYWKDPDGNKVTTLSPDLIDLHLLAGEGQDWIVDEKLSAQGDKYRERTILYYTKPLKVGETTSPLSDKLTIDSAIGTKVKQTDVKKEEKNGKTYTTKSTVYEYDGYQFMIEAQADAVQVGNAEDAIKSAWGREVTIDKENGGVLSFAQDEKN